MVTDDLGRPSDRLVEQRVRNRLIEYFELASSFEAQIDYQRAAPSFVHAPYEVINQWEDWACHLEATLQASTVYTWPEKLALEQFQVVWDHAVAAVSDGYPTLASVQSQPEWEDLRRCARQALTVFSYRGRLPEDTEVPS